MLERKNRIIMEMARPTLKDKGLPNKGSLEYDSIGSFVKAQALVNHLKVFGYICYICILDENRHNLDTKEEKRIFISYNSQSKGYIRYNL